MDNNKPHYLNLNLNDILGEEWVECKFTHTGNYYDFSGVYWASSYGRVKSFQKNQFRILTNSITRYGYCSIKLKSTKYKKPLSLRVHRLVLYSFGVKNKENKRCINHINGIKTDNRLINLEWNTHLENITHAKNNNLLKPHQGVDHHKAILTNKQVLEIAKKKIPIKVAAKKYKVSEQTICNIRAGKSWRHLTNIKSNSKKDYHGSRVYNAKLTEKDVIYIMSSKDKGVVLAKKFGVVEGVIYNIRTGIAWNWLTKIKK